jgi:hypothetical protein
VNDELWAVIAPLLPLEPPKPKGGHQCAFMLGVTPQEKGRVDLPLLCGMLAISRHLG